MTNHTHYQLLRLKEKGLYLKDLLMFELAKSPDPVFNEWLMYAIAAIFKGENVPKPVFSKGVNKMPITISVQVEDATKGKQIVDTLFSALGASAETDESAEPKKRGRKPKAENVKRAAATKELEEEFNLDGESEDEETEDDFGDEEETEVAEISKEDVVNAFRAYAKAKSPAEAKKVLGKFKVTKLTDLDPKHYAKAMDAVAL